MSTSYDAVAVVRMRKRSKSAARRGPESSRARARHARYVEGLRREHGVPGTRRR